MADLIDRQAAIEALRKRAVEKFSLDDSYKPWIDAFIEAEDILRYEVPEAEARQK